MEKLSRLMEETLETGLLTITSAEMESYMEETESLLPKCRKLNSTTRIFLHW